MYRNWSSNKKIPEGMMVYKKKWVIPEELEDFMPPDDILMMPGCSCVYYVDGMEHDLYTHEWSSEED